MVKISLKMRSGPGALPGLSEIISSRISSGVTGDHSGRSCDMFTEEEHEVVMEIFLVK